MSTQANPQQIEIIENFGRGQAVIAGAGCGKTTTLVAKCVRLLQLKPEARFCAVSFTEKSVRDLRKSLTEAFQKSFQGAQQRFDRHQHWVKTIHGLCYTIIQEYPDAAGLAGGEKILLEDESDRLWRRSLEPLWTQDGDNEIAEALARLLRVHSRPTLESLWSRLRSLEAFGAEEWIQRSSSSRLKDLWLTYATVKLRFQRMKLRAGAVDFNDLETLALRALKQPRVARDFRQRFDLVLVDEFQDTNPVQGRILELLVRPGFENLCIVGDPKQSIYRFRDADVSVFQDLTSRVPLQHLLTTNYRSRPAIIEFVNQVCDPLFNASEMSYEPLVAGRPQQDSKEGTEPTGVFQVQIQQEAQLAQYLQSLVEKGVELSDVVLLARSVKKDQTVAYLEAFERAQIPYLFGSGGRFYSDPRVQELVAFLKGWLTPNNSLSQVAALRSPWIGIDDAKIQAWAAEGRGYFDSFFTSSEHPIARQLGSIYLSRKAVRPGEVLSQLWSIPELPEEMLLSIATLWQKCEDMSAQGMRYHDIVSQLDRWIDQEKIEGEVPPPATAGAVRVMTVHASKGLQFKHVILIDFEKATRADGRRDLLWNREQGVYIFERDEFGKKLKDEEHPENGKWSEIERRADVAESKRVFYVALTRAQESLHLVWKQKEKEDYKDREVDLARDYWRAWVEHLGKKWMSPVVVSALESTQAGAARQAPLAPSLPSSSVSRPARLKLDLEPFRPRHSASEWLILHQCPLRYAHQYQATIRQPGDSEEFEPRSVSLDFTDLEIAPLVSIPESQNDPSQIEPSESVAEKGERVHAHLEHEQWEQLEKEFSPGQGTSAVAQIRSLLESESGLDGAKVWKEVGFEVPFTGDEALVGVMDRLVITPDQISITDYKWTAVPRPKEVLLEHYLLQLQIYAWAARKMWGKDLPVSARLIHMTSGARPLEIVEAPSESFEPKTLENLVGSYFERAKQLLFKTDLTRDDREHLAQPGKHCRHCAYQKACPKVDAFGIL